MSTLSSDTVRTQNAAIRAHLLQYGEIDKRTALEICDCDRLGARIWDIRHSSDNPLEIVTEYEEKKNRFGHLTRYAVYKLKQ